jgi:predicted DNA-binding protein with PD1-like motif
MTPPGEPLAVRLEAPVALPEAILEAARRARLDFADAAAFGALDWMELDRDGAGVRLDGPFELLDLKGRIRRVGDEVFAEFVVIASRFTDTGLQLLGGRLRRASGAFLELRLTPLSLQGASVGPPAQRVAAPAPPAAPAPAAKPVALPKPPGDRWAEALAESKKLEKSPAAAKLWLDDGATAVVPQRGDFVDHRQFGRCLVVRVDDEHISLRKPDGRIVQLGLPILEFSQKGAEGEAAVYDVQVRRG